MTNRKIDNEVEIEKVEHILGSDDRISNFLLDSHVHIINGDIDADNIKDALRWLIHENLSDEEKTLTLYINSTGGDLCDAFALIDMMRSSKHPIRTIGIGNVMSSAFMIFAAGTPGERYIGKNASILCHQYSDEMQAKHHDLKAQIMEGERMNERMIHLLEEQTGLPKKTIKTKLLKETDVWLSADEMIEYGIADHIL
jgi:ATP-dependent Clp protease, protease subunit